MSFRTLRSSRESCLWAGGAIFLWLLLAVVLAWRINRPFTYNDDYNDAFWSQAARNLDRAGPAATAGVPAPLYFGSLPIPRDSLYVHHPTLLADLAALNRRVLGGGEWAARALPICFSLLTAGVLWLLVRSSAAPRRASLTLALFVAAPMELHYGQMLNFEAPELFFLLAALASYFHWKQGGGRQFFPAGFLICMTLAMWTDWPAYLMVILVAPTLLARGSARDKKLAAALLGLAVLSGAGFLLQIRLANPGSWQDLLQALRERSGHGNLSGSTFTMAEWLRTEFTYLTTLYHPFAWLLALTGAIWALIERRDQDSSVHAATLLLALDAIYICALRNQSFVHDFAGFYFLAPVAIFGGLFLERLIDRVERSWRGRSAIAASIVAAMLVSGLIYSGIRRLGEIDTQFCILDDDTSEPANLMPDLGRLIDRIFPPEALVLCNFDPYYSPLPYYAQRTMANNLLTYDSWHSAAAEASEPAIGGVVWMGAPGGAELAGHFPAAETKRVEVDGIPFCLWLPPPGSVTKKP